VGWGFCPAAGLPASVIPIDLFLWEIQASEMKTHLPGLLDEVERGKTLIVPKSISISHSESAAVGRPD
jgi:hypothetical protein